MTENAALVDSNEVVAVEDDNNRSSDDHLHTTAKTNNDDESNKMIDDSQTFDVVRDETLIDEKPTNDDQTRLSELKIESTNVGRSDDESHLSNDRTASPQLLNDDELKMFEHLAQLDYETEKKEQHHNESFGNSSANLDESVEQPLIHSQISVSNTVESEEYTITTNYTISVSNFSTTTHPVSSVNINTSVISESSSTDDLELKENKVEIPVEVSLSPRQIGKSIIPGLNALRGSTMLPSPPSIDDQQMNDEEYDDFHEISLGNDGTPQKKGKKKQDVNESFDNYECNVFCFAQPISYLFHSIFSNNDSNYSNNDNEVEMNVHNNKQIEA